VITGAGRAFCAGADLGVLDAEGSALVAAGKDVALALRGAPQPVLAAVNGPALAGGLDLAVMCDIRVAADDIQFGFYHMRRGMHFGDGGIVRLVNTCGVGIAMELELMGEPITAQRAKECHLVNRVVPRQELMSTVEDIAAKILRNPRVAVESAKETIFEVIGRTLDEQLKVECLFGYALCGGNPELERRSKEFLDKKDAGRTGVNATPL